MLFLATGIWSQMGRRRNSPTRQTRTRPAPSRRPSCRPAP